MVTSVAGTSRRRNKVRLLLPYLYSALIDGGMEQMAWSSRLSSDMARFFALHGAGLSSFSQLAVPATRARRVVLEKGCWSEGG